MAKPKKEFVFLKVAEEEKFSKIAVYILSGWTIGTDGTRNRFIYVGSTTTGSRGGRYGKTQIKLLKNVANLKRTDLHRFSKKDWLPSEYLKLNPGKKLFTTDGLRAYETRAIKAIKKFLGRHGAEFKVLNIKLASLCCLTGKCRGTGCTECCGVKLPTELPSMRSLVKKTLGEILDD
jgi:hypothetical protein|tara:strand:- start:220 stop:750 length:531 start_codon:yes stop_codon:yes gene_type:complete